MKLELLYPDKKPYNFKELSSIPNKYGQDSGYLLIAMIRSYSTILTSKATRTIDRYVCFTNIDRNQVWIEKLTLTRPRQWFAFDDTIKIEDDKEFNLIHQFLIDEGILD